MKAIQVLSLTLAMGLAQAADVHVLCSNGMKSVVEEVKAGWEKSSGNKLNIEFNATTPLKASIASGATFDVAILTQDAADQLVKDGKLAGPKVLGHSSIGLGIRKGASKPDLRGDGLKKFLLSAKSIAYTEQGASRPFVDRMFEKLGIMAAVKPKLQLLPPSQAAERVGRGEAEVVLTLVSEIMPIEGVTLVGALPDEFQGNVVFSGSLSPKAANAAAARQFIDYLASTAVAPVLKAKGMGR